MHLNPELIQFLVVSVFSFLIGLEVRSYRINIQSQQRATPNYFFGDVRTFSFVGMLGYVLFKIPTEGLYLLYLAGFLLLGVMYALLYRKNLEENRRSILLFVVMLLVYSFGALIQTEPFWLSALVYVSIVFILNADKSVDKFVGHINISEFETLGKMLLLSAVILPLLPDTKSIPYIPLSPFKIWLAVVVISAISYGGYILQKYFFPSKGYYLTGLLGGSYSSTATTVVLARKLRKGTVTGVLNAAIISATSVMYLRLVIIALIFNFTIGKALAIPFVLLSLSGFVISFFYLKNLKEGADTGDIVDRNPLELRTAFVFAGLFVVMIVITQYVTQHYGSKGLELLSFVVGFTDIDPFILSILTGKFSVSDTQIISAIMIAAGSNNLLKAIYALWFGSVRKSYPAALWIALLGGITIALGLGYESFLMR